LKGMCVLIRSESIAESISFYVDKLGLFELEVILGHWRPPREADLLMLGTDNCRLLLRTYPDVPPARLVVFIDSWEDVEKRLKEHDITIHEEHHLPYGIQAHVIDPCGNRLVLNESWLPYED